MSMTRAYVSACISDDGFVDSGGSDGGHSDDSDNDGNGLVIMI